MKRLLVALALVFALVPVVARANPLPGAESCPMFPADSFWHADVSQLPVDTHSAQYVSSIGLNGGLKADFGSGTWDGGPIGIPYTTVPGSQQRVPVSFDYADESDPGPYPIPANAPIEGGPQSTGDRHVLVVDHDGCRLYELFDAHHQGDGSWHAGSGAVYDLRSNALRPSGWTSADAAGLAMLPGLVRYDEVAAGQIDHAIRVTVPRSDRRFIWPARHQAGSAADPSLPPMGLRLRLKANVDISGFPPADQVILQALKRYGMIVADNGSAWYMSGVPDERWDNDVLHALGGIKGSSFEAVDESSLMIDPSSGATKGGPSAPPPDPRVAGARLAGADRVGTAVAVSKAVFASAPAAVVTGGASFADALAAAPLASAAGGPVLLTASYHLDAATKDELARLKARTAYVVGGTAAVSQQVASDLTGAGLVVVRVSGNDRFGTASAAATRAVDLWRTGGDVHAGEAALVASGQAWADALAAGALAGQAHRPLLLVQRDSVPAATSDALSSMGTTDVTVIGGSGVVSDAVVAQLHAHRLAGADRWATAVAVAQSATGAGADAGTVLAATGRDFPDGLAAGAAAAGKGGIVLLTDRDAVPDATRAWLGGRHIAWLRVAGGPSAVTDATVSQLLDAEA